MSQPALIPLAQMQARLHAQAPRMSLESIHLPEALGRINGVDCLAPLNQPAAPCSAMDGYALNTKDCASTGAAPISMPVSQTIYAGQPGRPLQPGSCARLFTGSLVPDGADAVVIQEQVQCNNNLAGFVRPPEPGTHIRPAASMFARGQLLLAAGLPVTPQRMALLACATIARLQVRTRPRVALLSCGDELLPLTRAARGLQDWQVCDSNQPMLAALLGGLGCRIQASVHLDDNPHTIRAGLSDVARQSDVVVSCGGASVGDKDHFYHIVKQIGRVDSWKVAIRPGKPFLYGRVGDTPVLCLPGNPLSAWITALLLVRPFLAGMLGVAFARALPQPSLLQTNFAYTGDARRVQWLQVQSNQQGLQLAGGQQSDQLLVAAHADGLAMLAPGQKVQPGDSLPYLSYPSLVQW